MSKWHILGRPTVNITIASHWLTPLWHCFPIEPTSTLLPIPPCFSSLLLPWPSTYHIKQEHSVFLTLCCKLGLHIGLLCESEKKNSGSI